MINEPGSFREPKPVSPLEQLQETRVSIEQLRQLAEKISQLMDQLSKANLDEIDSSAIWDSLYDQYQVVMVQMDGSKTVLDLDRAEAVDMLQKQIEVERQAVARLKNDLRTSAASRKDPEEIREQLVERQRYLGICLEALEHLYTAD